MFLLDLISLIALSFLNLVPSETIPPIITLIVKTAIVAATTVSSTVIKSVAPRRFTLRETRKEL